MSFKKSFPEAVIQEEVDKNIEISERSIHKMKKISRCCHFPSPHNKIVVASRSRIRIFESINFSEVGTLEFPSKDAIKWTENEFMIASKNNTTNRACIRVINIVDYSEIKRITLGKIDSVHRLLKLNDNIFVGRFEGDRILVIDYEKSEVVKKVFLGEYISTKKELVLSKRYHTCFYCSVESRNDRILLVDPLGGNIVKKFPKSKEFSGFRSFCIFEHREKEILVICVTDNVFYIIDTSRPEYVRNLKMESRVVLTFGFFKFEHPDKIFTSFVFQNKYLCCSGRSGQLRIFKIHFDTNKLILLNSTMISIMDPVNYIQFIENSGKIILLSCDQNFRISGVRGIECSLFSDQSKIDERERRLFLFQNQEKYIFGKKGRKECLISMKLINSRIDKFLRILFL